MCTSKITLHYFLHNIHWGSACTPARMQLNRTLRLYACLQVVVTDVDECLEALHDNISANLPAHCTLVPECLAQPNAPLQSASFRDRHSDAEATCLDNASPNVQGSQHHAHQDDLDSAGPACLPSMRVEIIWTVQNQLPLPTQTQIRKAINSMQVGTTCIYLALPA